MTLLLLFSSLIVLLNGQTFAFGNTQGDWMVLQQSPYRAQVWGTSPSVGATVVIQLLTQNDQVLLEETSVETDSSGIWKTYLSPRAASNDEYIIRATLNTETSIELNYILFGDVYVCSGQSNMEQTVSQAFNASQEIDAANNFPYIRVFTAQNIRSVTPQTQLLGITQPWSVASSVSIGGPNWQYFSAVCWFFGRDLNQYLNYPIGLISTTWGGTPIRDWSSPDALAQCGELLNKTSAEKIHFNKENYNKMAIDPTFYTDFNKTMNKRAIRPSRSQLWNAMIYPFLQTTIRGAIWYQGESDANNQYAELYACMQPAMINDWRLKWSLYSDTSPDFGFGLVQLSTWNDNNAGSNTPCGNNIGCTDVAVVRWGQTANFGYVPNPMMQHVFMAVAIDVGDPNNNPYGDIHPRYKQEVGERLSTAGKDILYGDSQVYWPGPIADNGVVNGNDVVVNFRNVGENGLFIKNSNGFEVAVDDNGSQVWFIVIEMVRLFGNNGIAIPIPSDIGNVADVVSVRYNWYTAPCSNTEGPYNCAIYDAQYELPATPFILTVTL